MITSEASPLTYFQAVLAGVNRVLRNCNVITFNWFIKGDYKTITGFKPLKSEDFLILFATKVYLEYIWSSDCLSDNTSDMKTSPWALGNDYLLCD